MVCGTIPCKPEQGIKSSEQGKTIARSGTGRRRQRSYQGSCSTSAFRLVVRSALASKLPVLAESRLADYGPLSVSNEPPELGVDHGRGNAR